MTVIHVLHIDAAEIWGGGQSQIATLIRESSELPIQHYLATPQNSKLWFKVRQHISGFFPLPRSGSFNPLAMKRIRDFCMKNNIQIIHAHCGKSHTFAYWLKTLFMPNVKLVVHRRIPQKIRSNWLSKIKFTSPTVNHFISVSNYIRNVLVRGGVEADRITTVRSSKRPFVSDPSQKSTAREDLLRIRGLADGGDYFIVSASRLVPDKGLFVLIEAFRMLSRQRPQARLIIAGEGPLEKKLKIAGRALIDSGHLVFLGFRKDVQNLLLGADVFAIPSLSEGLGSTIIEAMMANTAVIGSAVEGIPELITNDVSGLLVPPGNANALFEALLALAIDPKRREHLANAGYSWALESCRPNMMIQKTFDIYRAMFDVPDEV